MDCKEVNNLITEYLDDELSMEQRKAMEAHLADCASCRREIDDHRSIQAALRDIGRESVSAPAGFTGKVMAELERETVKPRRRFAWLPAAWHKGVAAAAIFLVLAGGAAGFNSELRIALRDKVFVPEQTVLVTINNPDGSVTVVETKTTDIDIAATDATTETDASANVTGHERTENAPIIGGDPAGTPMDEVVGEQPVTDETVDVQPVNVAPEQEKRALLADGARTATSTYLRITAADLHAGKTQATALATAAGATVQAYPEQQEADGKKTMRIILTAPAGKAQGLIADLAALGVVQKNQNDKKDLTTRYNEVLVDYNDTLMRKAKETNQTEKQRLEAQMESYNLQLAAWDEEAGNQIISLILESGQ